MAKEPYGYTEYKKAHNDEVAHLVSKIRSFNPNLEHDTRAKRHLVNLVDRYLLGAEAVYSALDPQSMPDIVVEPQSSNNQLSRPSGIVRKKLVLYADKFAELSQAPSVSTLSFPIEELGTAHLTPTQLAAFCGIGDTIRLGYLFGSAETAGKILSVASQYFIKRYGKNPLEGVVAAYNNHPQARRTSIFFIPIIF